MSGPGDWIRGRLGQRVRDDGGQSAVEFALMVPIMVIMILGMVEFARLWMQYQVVTDAARESARMVVIEDGKTVAQKQSAVAAALSSAASAADIQGTVTPYWSNAATGACQTVGTNTQTAEIEVYDCGWAGARNSPATVTIRAPYEFQYLNVFLPGTPTIMLTTSFTMRNE